MNQGICNASTFKAVPNMKCNSIRCDESYKFVCLSYCLSSKEQIQSNCTNIIVNIKLTYGLFVVKIKGRQHRFRIAELQPPSLRISCKCIPFSILIENSCKLNGIVAN